MATDRSIVKLRREGTNSAFGLASDPSVVTADQDRRQRDFIKTGSENAATNVAEATCFSVLRKSKLKAVSFLEVANITASNTDYTVIKVYWRGGETATLLASYNTSGTGQGAVTRFVPATFNINVTSDNHILAANSVVSYELVKGGNGKAISANTPISFDFEEV